MCVCDTEDGRDGESLVSSSWKYRARTARTGPKLLSHVLLLPPMAEDQKSATVGRSCSSEGFSYFGRVAWDGSSATGPDEGVIR